MCSVPCFCLSIATAGLDTLDRGLIRGNPTYLCTAARPWVTTRNLPREVVGTVCVLGQQLEPGHVAMGTLVSISPYLPLAPCRPCAPDGLCGET